MDKSGVRDRCWAKAWEWAWTWAGPTAKLPVKGLVHVFMLSGGREDEGLLMKGLGDTRVKVSCERLRDGTGGGGKSEGVLLDSPTTAVREEDEEDEEVVDDEVVEKRGAECRERGGGSVAEEAHLGRGGGREVECEWGGGPERRELLRVNDWVLSQVDELGKIRSEARVLKGSDFHCASCWRPFNPFSCYPDGCSCEVGVGAGVAPGTAFGAWP